MDKRIFILALAITACALAGWFYYVSTQARQAQPVAEISVDWWGSAHADITSESFTHWNEDEPPEVPVNCAKCHSGRGFLDYLGQDGSTAFSVDSPAAIESVISCEVCHNEQANALQIVTFPSGIEFNLQPGDALCATCHSGLSAGSRVESESAAFQDDDDEIIPEASLITPHYAFAAATWLGADAQGGYQYEGKTYASRFKHAEGVQTCTQCHDPHSLHMHEEYGEADLCAACHSNVTGYLDYRDVFVDGLDYDGDGTVEGLYHEIEGMREVLYLAIQRYAASKIGQTIGWADQFPYLFNDTNSDGFLSKEEAAFPNLFVTFTPRLLRTAFNFQFSIKDPAGYVHNGKYILQLLYDAIEDLSAVIDVDTAALVRPE